MGRVILNISMSLDGFIAGPKDDEAPERELAALARLHGWMFGGKTEQEVEAWQAEAFKTIGAVVIGRRTFDLGAGFWGENPPFHAPCFVLSRAAQETIVKHGGTTYTFVTDGIESAIAQARAAAGDKDVRLLGGARAAQHALEAGLLDELQLQLVPVLLGEGIRLFEQLDAAPIELERLEVVEEPGITHLRFRVVR